MRLPRSWLGRRVPEVWDDGRTVVSITIARNEQDVIEPFVRHNLRVLDRMVVLDHGSVDDTRTILDRLAAETGRVVVAALRGFGFEQSALTTRLLHRTQDALRADFVLPLDADEFLAVSDRSTMLRAFDTIAVGGAGLIPWRTYVLTGRRGEANDPPRSLRHRRVAEVPRYRKVVLRFDGASAADILVEMGAHIVHSATTGAIPLPDLDGVTLIHVPIRSSDQLVNKTVIALMSYHRGARLTPTSPLHLATTRALFDRVASGQEPFASVALRKASAAYAQDAPGTMMRDPGPWSYRRRYSDGSTLSPLALIARSWEAAVQPQVASGDDLDAALAQGHFRT